MTVQKILLLIISLMLTGLAYGQNSDTKNIMSYKKVFLGTRYYQGEAEIEKTRFINNLKQVVPAYDQFKSGKNLVALGTLLGAGGGYLLGFEAANLLQEQKNVNQGNAIVGVLLTAGSFFTNHVGNSKMESGLRRYNKSAHKYGLDMKLHGDGVGLALTF